MLDERAQAALHEARRRWGKAPDPGLLDGKFPEQDAFVLDQSMFVGAQCTRRAGKSNGIGKRLMRKAAKYPHAIVPYIALTRESAHNIMWPVFEEINRVYRLGATLTESNLTVTMPNQARIVCFGADMKNFIDRLRGPKYPEVAVDEAQSFGVHIKEMIDDILTPAISDFEDGAITLTGTPGPVPSGYFFDACHGKEGYSLHKWSVFNNPYMPRARQFVTDLKAKKGWSDENPTYLREWCNQWVIDLDALVYKFKKERNLYDGLPTGLKFERVLAVDYGWNDQTAFAVVAFSEHSRHVFVEHVEGHAEMVPSDIAARLQQLREKYQVSHIVADTGGLGKSITEEFRRRFAIPIKAAEKTEKLTAISILNGDFIDGHCLVHRSLTRLHDQYNALIKGDDHKEDPSLPNDLCDAVLYAFREAKHYMATDPEPVYEHGTKEWGDQESSRMEAAEMERLERSENQPDWMKW
jgi:hypothetical protein